MRQLGPEIRHKLKKALFKSYVSILEKLVLEFRPHSRIEETQVYLSTIALSDCVSEIIKDIEIMVARRPKGTNLTRGKYAGIIVYRLTRYNIIQLEDAELREDRDFLKIANLAAILVGLNWLNVEYFEIPDMIRIEIQYTLIRRHMNQETLGLVFDTIKHYVS